MEQTHYAALKLGKNPSPERQLEVRGSRYLTLLRSISYSGGTCIVAVSGTAIGAGPGAVAGAGAATCGWGLGC